MQSCWVAIGCESSSSDIVNLATLGYVRYLSQNWWEFIPLQGLCHNDLRASSVLLTSRRFWKWNGELWIILREGSSIKEFLSAGQGSRRSCSPEWCGSTCCNGHRRLALCHHLCSLNLDQPSRLRSVPFAHVFACPIMSQFEPPHSRIQRWFATQSWCHEMRFAILHLHWMRLFCQLLLSGHIADLRSVGTWLDIIILARWSNTSIYFSIVVVIVLLQAEYLANLQSPLHPGLP